MERNPEPRLSEKSLHVQRMFDTIAPSYDFLNRLLSFRQDVRWRNALIAALPTEASGAGTLYDVACGTGDVILQTLSRRNDYATFRGFDISAGMLRRAEERFQGVVERSTPLGKPIACTFTQASAENLPADDAAADAVSIAFGLRNVDDRGRALRDFFRCLKPGGALLVLEFFRADVSAFAHLFDFYFRHVLPKIGGLVSDREAYEYLPRSVSTMPAADEFTAQLEATGFNAVSETKWLSGGVRLFVARK